MEELFSGMTVYKVLSFDGWYILYFIFLSYFFEMLLVNSFTWFIQESLWSIIIP